MDALNIIGGMVKGGAKKTKKPKTAKPKVAKETKPKKVAEKKTKGKRPPSPWIKHCLKWAADHKITYPEAVRDPKCNAAYYANKK